MDVVRQAVAQGVVAYVIKPFTFGSFRTKIEQYLAYRVQLDSRQAALGQSDIDAMIATEEPGAFLARYHHLQHDRSGFRCPGNGAVAQRVNLLLAAGLSRIDDLVTLGCFADEAPEVEPAPETSLPDLLAG